jgi:hypothetical protein
MDQQEEWTCGKGLAASSALPERLGSVMAALAEVLDVHTEALDLEDGDSRREYEAYRSLSQQMRQIASQLAAVSREMVAYRDLPMGRHDMEAMTRPNVPESFESLVRRKQELLALLHESAEVDRQLLEQMNE